MTDNKQTLKKYYEGFSSGDYETIASCLTDDIVWKTPGTSELAGKEVFDKLKKDVSTGSPKTTINRMVEENNTVVVEADIQFTIENGNVFDMATCEIFDLEDGKIKRMTSYMAALKE